MHNLKSFQFLLSVLLSATLAVLVSYFLVQAQAICGETQGIACLTNILYVPDGALINDNGQDIGLIVAGGSVLFGTGEDPSFKLTVDGGIKAKVPAYVSGDHKYALYLENSATTNNSLFSVRDDGAVTASGDITAGGQSVCRKDGTNCPAVAATVSVPTGMIAMFDTSCPTIGWTRFSALDDRVPRGATTYGTTGGADTHSHTLTTTVNNRHNFGSEDHYYYPTLNTDSQSSWPKYMTVIWCKKN